MDFHKKNLIIYITAGFPDFSFTQKAILRLQELGVEAIEVGIPYSDPVADGAVISEASLKSLARGTNLDGIFRCLEEIKADLHIPIYLMGYYSPVFSYGEDKFIEKALRANVAGSIIPDLIIEDGASFFQKEKASNLDPILLVFPNTPDKRIEEIATHSGSFIYYVNLFGTTGANKAIPEISTEHLIETKRVSGKPVCAGFGVNDRESYQRLIEKADGVIIGSAVMKRVLQNENEPTVALEAVSDFVRSLR